MHDFRISDLSTEGVLMKNGKLSDMSPRDFGEVVVISSILD
jgi:hypothetical protein